MKLNKESLHQQRDRLDDLLKKWKFTEPPRSGWLKSIREAVGLTSSGLAEKLGVSTAAVLQLEAREKRKSITLESLEQTARSMDCKLVYAIVPSSDISLEELVQRRSLDAAKRIIKDVSHSMKLENQPVPDSVQQKQVEVLAKKLKEGLDKSIWSENK